MHWDQEIKGKEQFKNQVQQQTVIFSLTSGDCTKMNENAAVPTTSSLPFSNFDHEQGLAEGSDTSKIKQVSKYMYFSALKIQFTNLSE